MEDGSVDEAKTHARSLWALLDPLQKEALTREEFSSAIKQFADPSVVNDTQFLEKILGFLKSSSDKQSNLIRYEDFESAFIALADSLQEPQNDEQYEDNNKKSKKI